MHGGMLFDMEIRALVSRRHVNRRPSYTLVITGPIVPSSNRHPCSLSPNPSSLDQRGPLSIGTNDRGRQYKANPLDCLT